jgi:isoleucyl-tRNA synthetase
VRKDRLYCDGNRNPLRIATQKVLYRCLRVLTAGMAPILCFTAEEVWGFVPRLPGDPDSVHLALLEAPLGGTSAAAPVLWEMLWTLRQDVQKALEAFRAQKRKTLDAAVALAVDAQSPLGRELPEDWLADFFIVSNVTIARRDAAAVEISVTDAEGAPCQRCWKRRPTQPLCDRCKSVVGGS